MRTLRRLVAFALLLCLVLAGTASADHQEPQKRLTKADNARARAMLLTRADVPGFAAIPGQPDEPHVDCAASVSEADLTLTGEAEGRQFQSGPAFAGSSARVFGSVADANASWRRSTTAAALDCGRDYYRRNFEPQGGRLRSLSRIAFPRISERTAAYRLVITVETPQGTLKLFADLIALQHGRAHATLFLGAALAPPARTAELKLARLVAARMTRAMRG